ncbi:MAG: Ig-like domain-containing protein [Luteibacter sp.]
MKTLLRDANAPNAPVLPRMIITATHDGGLGYFDLVPDAYASIAMVLGPLSLDEVGPGDTLRAYMTVEGEAHLIASYVLNASDFPTGDESTPIFTLEAKASEINRYPDGAYPFSYEVLYSNGASDSNKEPLDVRIKRTIPGAPLQPSEPVNELLSPPEVFPNPVTDGDTSAKVTASAWTHMSEGDLVTVHWGQLKVTSAPIASVGIGQPVTVTITAEQLREVGGMIGLPVAYEVFDVVGNHSGRSPYTFVDVEIEPPGALPEPRILEAAEGTIDPGKQDGRDFTILVPSAGDARKRNVTPAAVAPGDRIVAYFEGRIPGTGQTHRYTSPPLTAPNPIFDLRIALPLAETLPLRGGTAQVSYHVTPLGGGPELLSRHMGVVVVGVPAVLPAPTIPEDANRDDRLDPDSEIVGGAHALIDYPDMAVNDLIYLDLAGRRADGTADNLPVSPRQVSRVAPQSIPIDKSYLLRLKDGRLTLKYSADSDSVVVRARRDSAPRTVSIGNGIVQPALPPPTLIPPVTGGLLDPTTRDAQVIVGEAVLQIGDVVEYSWRARQTASEKLTVRLNGDLRFALDDALISGNLDSDVAVTYTRTRDGVTALSDPLRFRIAAASQPLPAPVVAQDVNGQVFAMSLSAGMTVRIPAEAGIAPTDLVQFIMYGNGQAGSHASEPSPTTSGEYTVPASHFGWNFGVRIKVLYRVIRGATQTDSPMIELDVIGFANEDAQLPRPTVIEAIHNILDLERFDGDATVLCTAWPLIAVDQRIWLDAEGVLDNGSATRTTIASASNVLADEISRGPARSLSRSWLAGLKHGSHVDVRLAVSFDGSTQKADAIAFRLLTLTLRTAAPALTIDPALMELEIGQSRVRQASGGTPPYSYSSSKPGVVSVPDATVQIVTAIGAGTAEVTAADQAGARAAYPVRVKALPTLSDDFESAPLTAKKPLKRPHFTVHAMYSVANESHPPYVSGHALFTRTVRTPSMRDYVPPGGFGPVGITLDSPAKSVSCGLFVLGSGGTVFTVTHTDGTSSVLPAPSGSSEMKYTAPGEKRIEKFEFSLPQNNQQLFVDNVTLTP